MSDHEKDTHCYPGSPFYLGGLLWTPNCSFTEATYLALLPEDERFKMRADGLEWKVYFDGDLFAAGVADGAGCDEIRGNETEVAAETCLVVARALHRAMEIGRAQVRESSKENK